MKDINEQYLEGGVMPGHLEKKTQTEELKRTVEDIISNYHNQVPFADEVADVLRACKEAGLKFVDYRLPISELGHTCEHQIKEIEIE